jgi:hypothetical protein
VSVAHELFVTRQDRALTNVKNESAVVACSHFEKTSSRNRNANVMFNLGIVVIRRDTLSVRALVPCAL